MQSELIDRQKQTIVELNKGKEQLIQINKELESKFEKESVQSKPIFRDDTNVSLRCQT